MNIIFLTWLHVNTYSQLCSTARYNWITLRYYLYISSVERGRDIKTNRARHHWLTCSVCVVCEISFLSFDVYLTTASRLLNNKKIQKTTIITSSSSHSNCKYYAFNTIAPMLQLFDAPYLGGSVHLFYEGLQSNRPDIINSPGFPTV